MPGVVFGRRRVSADHRVPRPASAEAKKERPKQVRAPATGEPPPACTSVVARTSDAKRTTQSCVFSYVPAERERHHPGQPSCAYPSLSVMTYPRTSPHRSHDVTRRAYPNPPIVEAAVEFRFAPTLLGSTLLAALRAQLGDTYCGEQREQNQVELQATVGAGKVTAEARQTHLITLLSSRDGRRVVGCGDGRISVHVLAPYPGWESFVEQIQQAMASVQSVVGNEPLQQVIVRYIDRMALPDDTTSFNELITAMPSRPAAMPAELDGFHFLLQATDDAEEIAAELTLASAERDAAGRPTVIYDLLLRTTRVPCCANTQEAWMPLIERLHARQKEIFEDSITQRMRDSFE